MTARIVTCATRHISARMLVAVTLVSALLAVVLSHALLATSGGSEAPRVLAADASARALGGLSPAARASISASLGADEQGYHFTRVAGGFRAANPAQQLAVTAGRAGVSVRERDLELGFGLQAVGYGNRCVWCIRSGLRRSRIASRTPARRSATGTSNGPLGLEQGFIVNHAPALHAAGPLTLAIGLSGNAHASLGTGGQSVRFTAQGARALRYEGLSVTDASGRALHSGWRSQAGACCCAWTRAARATRCAWTRWRKLKRAAPERRRRNRTRGHQRCAVSDGATALVGAPAGEEGGAVWVFSRNARGEYEQSEELTSGDAEVSSVFASCGEEQQAGEEPDECRFGSSLAISPNGETAVVQGAPGANNREGACSYSPTRIRLGRH